MYFNRYHIGLIDPYQYLEPGQNTAGFLKASTTICPIGIRTRILQFYTELEEIFLAYAFLSSSGGVTNNSLLEIVGNGGVLEEEARFPVAKGGEMHNEKLNLWLPKHSDIQFFYTALDGNSITNLFISGWRKLR